MLHTKNYSYNEFAMTGANKFANTVTVPLQNTEFQQHIFILWRIPTAR